jgi:phosphatidylglycerol:prolipoprotein diacylglycerol transferase
VFPFVAVDESKIWPLHTYGVCCMVAFFVWDHVGMKMAVRRGFDRRDFRVLTVLLGVFGWSFAWGVDTIFYRSDASSGSGLGIQRLSSTGAIIGATLGTVLWSRFRLHGEGKRWRFERRSSPLPLLPVSEVILATWPIAFAFGRLGCALIHDHVGRAVAPGTIGSLFAVGFPRYEGDGVHRVLGPIHVITGASDVRYDLGLIELLVLAALAVGFALTWKREVKMGTYTIVASLVYGPVRFALDFIRAEDGPTGEVRHGGLTFAQYWSLAVIALGVVLLLRRRRDDDHAAAASAASAPAD